MKNHVVKTLACLGGAALMAASCWAQAFTSGSTGSDGAYSPTVSAVFDPVALGLNPAGDNVFNFTTINIPAGVTITLRADKLRNAPVVWLATGNVTIAGNLVLDGQAGNTLDASNFAGLVQNRVYPIPGPGGYSGGMGARNGVGPEAGAGPGGGPAGTASLPFGGMGVYYGVGSANCGGQANGTTYGSSYMVPLYGGSGGGGGYSASAIGGIGGAGGGAIRIVSQTQISVTGKISALGGDGGLVSNNPSAGSQGGGGSGGAIHLIAPTVSGAGQIRVDGGRSNQCGGFAGTGYIRLNTTNNNFTGGFSNTLNFGFFVGPLYNVPANNILSQPSLSILQINGVSVPASPTGSYLNPDIQINTTNAVNVNIAAANIPIGTVVNLRVTSETGADSLIACPGLAGATAASTTATCSATYPFSISVSSIRATW